MDWKPGVVLAVLSLISLGAKILMRSLQLRLMPAILRELRSGTDCVEVRINDPQGASLTMRAGFHPHGLGQDGKA